MRDWFYTKAKLFKQAAFFVSGTAVAASTATAIVDSTTSWISNLIAIVGCSVYSSFDNIETAHLITAREEKIQQRVKKLAMEDYQEGEPTVLLEEILENISSLDMKVDDVMAAIKKTAEELKQSLAQKYARTNWIAQMMTSIITGAINIWANVEEDTEDRENLLTPKNILNITLVPVCMLVWQCWGHYRTTKNLQEMTEKTENLECILSQASKSLVFRAYEFHQERLTQCCKELEIIESKLTVSREQLSAIVTKLTRRQDSDEERNRLEKERLEIETACDELTSQLNHQKEILEELKRKNQLLRGNVSGFESMEIKIKSEIDKAHELMTDHLLVRK